MKAIKCDRCGEFYIPDMEENTTFRNIKGLKSSELTFGGISFERMDNNVPVYANTFDICPECRKSLIEWWCRYDGKETLKYDELGRPI